MKVSFKMTTMVVGLVLANGLFAVASAAVDPDEAVLNALTALCTPANIAAVDGTGAPLKAVVDAAVTFFQSPNATQLVTAQGFQSQISAAAKTAADAAAAAADLATKQTNAKVTLTEALGATDFATLASKLNDSNFKTQFAWLKINAATDLTALYAKINTWYNGVLKQTTAANLAAYLPLLKDFSDAVKTNTTVFADQPNINGYADAVIAANTTMPVAQIAAGVGALMAVSSTNLTAKVLSDNTPAAKAWRTLKSKMPQQ